MAGLQIKDVNPTNSILQRRGVAVLALLGAAVLGSFVFFSSPLSQKLLGFKVSSLSSFAFQGLQKDENKLSVINCIKAPCPGDDTKFMVTSPQGGETWKTGSAQKIAWTLPSGDPSFAAATVNIALQQRPECLDATPPCAVKMMAPYVIAASEANDGDFAWTIPSNLSEAYLGQSRIVITNNTTGEQVQSGNIKILRDGQSLSFQVTSPANGDHWKGGNAYKIIWTLGSDPSLASLAANSVTITLNPVSLDCVKASDVQDCSMYVSRPYTIVSNANNSGSYEWNMSADFAKKYAGQNQVIVKINNTDRSATSGVFYIDSPSVSNELSILTESMAPGKVGESYSAQFKASGGQAPYNWSATIPQFQDQFKMDSVSGEFSVKPSRVGNYRVTVTVTDSNSIRANTYSKTYQWNVRGADVTTPHPEGSLVLNIKGSPTGVWLIENGFVRPFPSAEVFMSHGYKWSSIVQGNSGDEGLPIGQGFTLAPGTLIKPSNSLKMCLVYPNLVYRCFTSYAVFTRMGYKPSMAYPVSTTYLTNAGYTEGDAISDVMAHPMGTDISDNGTIYWVSEKGRRGYPNREVYNTWHTFNNDFSRVVPANDFDRNLILQAPMTARTAGQ